MCCYKNSGFRSKELFDFDKVFNVAKPVVERGYLNDSLVNRDYSKPVSYAPLDTYKKFVRTEVDAYKMLMSQMRTFSGQVLATDKDCNRGFSSVCLCGKKRIDAEIINSPVHLVKGENSGSLFYSGLMKCGSVWRCPVCSYKITKRRQLEVFELSNKWLGLTELTSEKKGRLSFITLTLRHDKYDDLSTLLDLLTSEFRKFQRTKVYKRLENEHNIKGFIKTLEIKYSEKNGWHPHLHLLYFHSSENTTPLYDEFLHSWCKRKNITASISAQNARDVYTEKGIADYITKWDMSSEMTQSNLKQSANSERYTPFGILRKLTLGDFPHDEKGEIQRKKFEVLFYKYARFTKGKHMIAISKNLRQEFKAYDELSSVEIMTDEQILSDEKIDRVELKIHPTLFNKMIFKGVHTLGLICYERGGLDCFCSMLFDFKVCEHEHLKYDEKSKLIYEFNNS